jgi:putative transposase
VGFQSGKEVITITSGTLRERIIRNELELDRIRQYIINNPRNWDADKNNQTQSSTHTDP